MSCPRSQQLHGDAMSSFSVLPCQQPQRWLPAPAFTALTDRPVRILRRSGPAGRRRSGKSAACRADTEQHSEFGPLSSPAFLRSQFDTAGWDVVGLGQSMVDFSAAVSDEFLEELGVEKGSRR